jgi:adenylate cyclase
LENGYWFATDLKSSNGTKLNGQKILSKRRLDPGCTIAFAKHQFEVQYDPESLGATGQPPQDDDAIEMLLRTSLMERAGLQQRPDKANSSEDGSEQ